CDEQLWEIIHIGLTKDRYARHASMTELGRALASWLVGHGVTDDACGTSFESRWFADDARPFASRPASDAEVAKPDNLEPERTTPAEPLSPPKDRTQTRRVMRRVIHRRFGIRAIKTLSLAAVVVTAFFAVTSNHDLSSLIAISKGATLTGARRAAS